MILLFLILSLEGNIKTSLLYKILKSNHYDFLERVRVYTSLKYE